MKTLLILISLTLATPALAGNLWTPGSQFNPYIITPGPQGQAQVTTQYPDFSRPMMAPGQPYNPFTIRQQSNGTITMQTDYPPDLGDNSGEDD